MLASALCDPAFQPVDALMYTILSITKREVVLFGVEGSVCDTRQTSCASIEHVTAVVQSQSCAPSIEFVENTEYVCPVEQPGRVVIPILALSTTLTFNPQLLSQPPFEVHRCADDTTLQDAMHSEMRRVLHWREAQAASANGLPVPPSPCTRAFVVLVLGFDNEPHIFKHTAAALVEVCDAVWRDVCRVV